MDEVPTDEIPDEPESGEGEERLYVIVSTDGKLWVQVVVAGSCTAVIALAGWVAVGGGLLEVVAGIVFALPAVVTLRALYLEVNGRLYGRPREPDPDLGEAREAAENLKREIRETLIDPWAAPLLSRLSSRREEDRGFIPGSFWHAKYDEDRDGGDDE